MLSCTMPHASDWLIAPPIPALGLGLQSDVFRTALKYRLGFQLYDQPMPCPAVSAAGEVCAEQMDVFGDHSICCHYGTCDQPVACMRHSTRQHQVARPNTHLPLDLLEQFLVELCGQELLS